MTNIFQNTLKFLFGGVISIYAAYFLLTSLLGVAKSLLYGIIG